MAKDILDISQIHKAIDLKAKQLGASSYEIKNRIITIQARKEQALQASGGFFYPKSIPTGVSLASIRGIFNLSNPFITEQILEHSGNCVLTNLTSKPQVVELVEMVIRR